MTTRLRSASVSKGLPVNYCSGFRSLSTASALEVDGLFLFSGLIRLASFLVVPSLSFRFGSCLKFLINKILCSHLSANSWANHFGRGVTAEL